MSRSHKTTFNVGDIIPIYTDMDILPGDTVQMDMAELVRMATPIYPVMDNSYMDIYWFFVPHRLVWDQWAEFWGENDDPWARTDDIQVPQITAPAGGWEVGTIAQYMGIPIKVPNLKVNAFAFRAYAKIFSDWFRNQNLKQAAHFYKDGIDRTGSNGNDYITEAELGGKPAKAAKLADYFTRALPEPQKGPAVELAIGERADIKSSTASGTWTMSNAVLQRYPVYAMTTRHGQGDAALKFYSTNSPFQTNNMLPLFAKYDNSATNGVLVAKNAQETAANMQLRPDNLYADPTQPVATTEDLSKLYADLSTASAITVNQLRTAFAIQKYYENAGLHGTRYIEYIRSVFGVTSSDARFQRSEYLGGERIPINMEQILQTSATNDVSPQGNTAGFSCTFNKDHHFVKSFEEHGTLMCLAVIRTEHTYQQGLHQQWTRKKWHQYYNPFFANLGEQSISLSEIYAQGNEQDDTAFGYQEAWASYRYGQNQISGYMNSKADQSLDAWHYGDFYTQKPVLGATWIDEPTSNVDRTIAVTSQLSHQFIADFYFKTHYTRPMPVYSIPGLIDHV